MNNLKERINEMCCLRNVSISSLLMSLGIHSSDYYLAVNGKKPFYPGWRKKISEALEVPEYELFPEYKNVREGE